MQFELEDQTRPEIGLRSLEEDPTIRGAYYGALKEKLLYGNEEEKEIAQLRFGSVCPCLRVAARFKHKGGHGWRALIPQIPPQPCRVKQVSFKYDFNAGRYKTGAFRGYDLTK